MNKKGFISTYALILLQLTMMFSLMLIERVKTSYQTHLKQTLDIVEIYAIQKVKDDLLHYEENDETIFFLDYQISLKYDDITCFITIHQEEHVYVESKLEFDDIEEEIISYTYLT